MTYEYHKAIEAIAQKITEDKPAHKNVAFIQLHKQALNIRDSVEAIGSIHKNPNPLETQEAHIKRVSKAAAQLATKVRETQVNIHHISQQGLRDVNERIRMKVNLESNGYAAEIRQAFRTMKPSEQIKMMKQLVDENRGPELAAIVNAPSILTGIDPEMQSRFADSIVSKHAAEEWEEKNALEKSMEAAFVASDVGKKVADEYGNPEKLAEIERLEAAAGKANADFSNSLINSYAPGN